MRDLVLALNAGSSSIKFAVYGADGRHGPELLARGQAAELDRTPQVSMSGPAGEPLHQARWPKAVSRGQAASRVLGLIGERFPADRIAAIGHRIVHGGPRFSKPEVLTPGVIAALQALVSWAPLHQPAALSIVRLAEEIWPGAVHLACFDTAFHHGQDPTVTRLGLPRAFEAEGLRRYGFHGLSCQAVTGRLAELDPEAARGRLLVAHLGAGASLSAVRDGRSVDTSMGFSPLDGLLMSTRCGALDPGVVLYLQQSKGMTSAQVEDLLYRRSGLLGVSGISGDMKRLLASGEPAAREAIELFVFRAAREAGALASSLGGLDGIVFTGGVGENAPGVRADICARLGWLGLELDAARNHGDGDRPISAPDSRVRAWVLATDEEKVIAEACAARLAAAGAKR